MAVITVDAVVIGGGVGGYATALRISQLGGKVALVERDRLGGVCLNTGCIPTKMMIQNIRQFLDIQKNPVVSGKISLDYSKLMYLKNEVVEMLYRGVEALLESNGVKIIKGEAKPENPNLVKVALTDAREENLKTKYLVIATGSKPRNIPGNSPDGNQILTSDDILNISSLPSSLLIVGGGYIGVEYATIFSHIGVRVTLVEMLPSILPDVDKELVKTIKFFLTKAGVEVFTDSRIEDLIPIEGQVKAKVKTPKGLKEVNAEKLLVAVGRQPIVEDSVRELGLDLHDGQIKVNKRMETNIPGVYAVGDVVGPPLLAHVAIAEGEVAAENIMNRKREIDYFGVPSCIFTIPEAASVGLTEEKASQDYSIKVGRFPFRYNAGAILADETNGFVKVIANSENRRILGVHIIGANAAELIAAVTVLIKSGKVEDLAEAIQAHPTMGEALTEAALDIDLKAIHIPKR